MLITVVYDLERLPTIMSLNAWSDEIALAVEVASQRPPPTIGRTVLSRYSVRFNVLTNAVNADELTGIAVRVINPHDRRDVRIDVT